MMHLFNTLTQRIEPLEVSDGRASLYVCGVTPYDTTHLGHAFTYVSFDLLLRLLRHRGIEVTYAQNVTDIDDDILRKSRELGLEYEVLADRETRRFREDMSALNVIAPDNFVAATDTISEIVKSIALLVDGAHAYVSDGNVYFEVSTFPGYGEITHGSREDMIHLASQHGGFPNDLAKRDPLDFLLWQKHLPGEPHWPSPFGDGRPGWHIECSTIATSVLGLPVTIHGGGTDLIFPHHASEIAQAESATGVVPFVEHWMHTAMVRMDGEKMSKSLGNMVFIRALLEEYSADAIRLYLLRHHYRQPFEWNQDDLNEMARLANRLTRIAREHSRQQFSADSKVVMKLDEMLANDLHSSLVVDYLAQMVEHGTESPGDMAAAFAWTKDVFGLRLTA